MILYKPVKQMTGCVCACVCLREVFVNTHPSKEECLQARTPFSLLSPACLPPQGNSQLSKNNSLLFPSPPERAHTAMGKKVRSD